MVINSNDPKCMWKCTHSLNLTNHVRPNELTVKEVIKKSEVNVMANEFNEFFTFSQHVFKTLETQVLIPY